MKYSIEFSSGFRKDCKRKGLISGNKYDKSLDELFNLKIHFHLIQRP